jgi:A/G-specific adenine glycosylase
MTPPAKGLRAAILRWYLKHRRDLPWRRTRDPYAIWVSEIMLQQTRVETVIPFYERFLERFPDVEALASAKEPEVLAAWSGLGYYRRARNIRSAAAMVVREHAGRIPEERDALERLPGIGSYTAAAVLSVAFGTPAAAVDGNVVRVLARIEGLTGRRDSPVLRREVTRRAEELALGQRPGDWTQALMELGATLCLPRDPLCDRCPARKHCRAARSGEPDRYPSAGTDAKPKVERRVMLVARRGGRVLLVPDPDQTWTLPHAAVPARRTPIGSGPRPSASRRVAATLARALGVAGEPRGPRSTFRHRTFSHDLTVEVWEVDSSAAPATRAGTRSLPKARWVLPDGIASIPVRATTLKALNKLRA